VRVDHREVAVEAVDGVADKSARLHADQSSPRAVLKMIRRSMKRSSGVASTSFTKAFTAFQYGRVREHVMRWSMLSFGSPHFKRHACDGTLSSFGSRLRTKSARWSSLRQLRSSVASDSGVPSVGQILSKGMGGPQMRDCQLASQLGGLVSTAWCV
jgi:hypothetical protein